VTEHHKGYEIEISSREKTNGWQATAKVTPTIAGIRGITDFGPAVTSCFKTQAEAEAAALMWAKQRIDQTANRTLVTIIIIVVLAFLLFSPRG
jgi:hypothetical protein